MSFSIVIPSRNASNLVACIRAIRQAGETARIIVVDDGIDFRGAPTELFTAPSVKFVPGQHPFIFARNVNIGIREAGEDDVLVLNDDALLQTALGFSMLAVMAAKPVYGIVSAACNNVGNVNQHYRRLGEALRDEPRMLCFIAVMIPRRTINAVGLLDEIFVDYGCEDDDFSLRVRNAGLKLAVFDGCFVDHASLHSSFRGPAGRGGNFHPNMKRFIQKWGHDNRGLTPTSTPRSSFVELF